MKYKSEHKTIAVDADPDNADWIQANRTEPETCETCAHGLPETGEGYFLIRCRPGGLAARSPDWHCSHFESHEDYEYRTELERERFYD